MTEDLLERRLSAAMEGRAAGARPGGPRFDDVEQRATRLRRRRAVGMAAAGAMSVMVLVALVAVAGTRTDGSGDMSVDVAADPPVTTPTGIVGDRWAVLADSDPVRWDPATEVVSGVQPRDAAGMQDVEVTPYLIAGPDGPDHEYLYPLDGASWTATLAYVALGDPGPSALQPAAMTTLLRGTGFDPSRFVFAPNSMNTYRPMASGADGPDGGIPNPYENARPEQLLGAPESTSIDPTVEHLGAFDWVLLPPLCEPSASGCRAVAVGGDAEQLIVVDATVPPDFDLRPWLADVQLRAADDLPTGSVPDTSRPGQVLTWMSAPFLTVRLPIDHDDRVWPETVPGDYCTAYETWKQVQVDHLGAFGTPGWIRWAEALDLIAPDEVGDAYRTLADETSAGHDVSATQPGIDALSTVVTYGDGHCA